MDFDEEYEIYEQGGSSLVENTVAFDKSNK